MTRMRATATNAVSEVFGEAVDQSGRCARRQTAFFWFLKAIADAV